MKIGIDFGSTYSLVSTFDYSTNNLKELQPDGQTAVTPSYLSIDDGEILYGNAAKSKVYDDNYRHFSGFKMMLVEKKNTTSGKQVLKKNGYDDQYSPRYITKLYLREMLNGILSETSSAGNVPEISEGFEQIFICVPELWAKNTRKMDGCYALREILNDELKLHNVNIVMEPEAASAYFAYTYEVNSGKKFNGHLFLIDFGGGTLDITLSKISSDDTGSIEIENLYSDGVGENHENSYGHTEFGQAGMAYMHRLVQNVLSSNGVNDVDILSSDFRKTIVDIEGILKNPTNIRSIKEYFSKFTDFKSMKKVLQANYTDISEAKNIFSQFRYNEKKYIVTFAQLYETYQQVIENELKDVVENMCTISKQYIRCDPRSIESGMNDDFKIALVGGFGSFYFVQKQIEYLFKFDEMNDMRTRDLTVSENEKAISFGAALLAAGKVRLKKTAPYSLGIELPDNRRHRLCYAIKFHQEIKAGEIHYIHEKGYSAEDDSKNPIAKFWGLNGITKFIVGDSPDVRKGYLMSLKPKYLEKLSGIPGGLWHLGFSIDDNYIITLHVVRDGVKDNNQEFQYKLSNYEEMFDLQMATQITDGEEIKNG